MQEGIFHRFIQENPEGRKEPLIVLDVHGYNVAIYAISRLYKDPSNIISPQLDLEFSFPDALPGEGLQSFERRKTMLQTIYTFLEKNLGKVCKFRYDLAGGNVSLIPFDTEHYEQEAQNWNSVSAHPMFFESKDKLAGKALIGVQSMRDKLSALLSSTRDNLDALNSEPAASESMEQEAERILSTVYYWELKGGIRIIDGETHSASPHYITEIFIPEDATGTFPKEKIEHGLRTFFAKNNFDAAPISWRGQTLKIHAEEESGKRLNEWIKSKTGKNLEVYDDYKWK